jgi:hypothetical protein
MVHGGKECIMVSVESMIESVIRDYIEAWYFSDPERMKRALHPDLAKRGYHIVPATGHVNLVHVSAANMVEYASAGLGKLSDGEAPCISIDVLNICGNTASAIATSLRYIDHIHLCRVEDSWSIVNVLWEPVTHADRQPS